MELPKTHASTSPPKTLGPFDRLLSLFRRGASDDAAASAGHVQFIGLERLRDHLGNDWDEEKERVHAAADSAIRGHLLKGDIHRRIHDVSFVVVFASLGRDAARKKYVLIADAIAKRLVGADVDLNLVLIRTAVLKEDGEVVLQQVAHLDGLVGHIAELPPEDPAAPMESWLAADPQDRRQRLEWCLRAAKDRFQPLWWVYRGTVFLYRAQPSRQARGQGLRHLIGLTVHFESTEFAGSNGYAVSGQFSNHAVNCG